jgi:hypothetical protein
MEARAEVAAAARRKFRREKGLQAMGSMLEVDIGATPEWQGGRYGGLKQKAMGETEDTVPGKHA